MNVLPLSLLKVNLISGCAAFAGYVFNYRVKIKSGIIFYLATVFISLLGAFVGMLLSHLLILLFFSPAQIAMKNATFRFSLATLLVLTIVIAFIAATIEILMQNNEIFKQKINDLLKESKPDVFIFKEKGSLVKIKTDDIVYLTASAKRTILHTVKQDIVCGMLLKNVEEKLPSTNFIRIHKKYLIHKDAMFRFYHIKSGMYEVLLNDDDETILPVGRAYLETLRKSLPHIVK